MAGTTREPLSPDARRQLREAVIERLRPFAWPDTRFVHDLNHFLPAYDGCEALTDVLPALPFWPGAGVVYATPDNCLEGVRSKLISERRPLVQTIAVRLGKGFGYFDIEWGILSALGIAHDATPIVVVCHDVQLLDDEFEPSPHDTLVDWIVTPTERIRVERARPKPSGIQWERLQPEQLSGMPPLRELQAMGL